MKKPNQRQQRAAAEGEANAVEGEWSDIVHAYTLGDESQSPDSGGGEEKQVCSSLHNGYIVCLCAKLRKGMILPTGCF